MDGHTKQVFLSGLFVYISTVSGLVLNYSVMQENHAVRISALETVALQSDVTLKLLTADMVNLRVRSASVEVLLETINGSVVALNKTNSELVKIVAKLEERSKNKTQGN